MATDFITNNSTIIQIQKNYNKAYEIVAEHKENVILEKLYTKVQLVNEREKDQNHRRGFGNRYAR